MIGQPIQKVKRIKKRNPTADSETASPQPQAALPKKKKYTESDDLPTHVPKGSDICVVCKELFTSRNKLFQHVKTTGHAAPLPQAKKGKKKRINLIYNNVHKYQLMSILNQFLIFDFCHNGFANTLISMCTQTFSFTPT